MTKIFISYRRDDSQYVTDSIYEHMGKHFGEENVFLDVGSIPFGVDFRQYLREQIQHHDVVLVIIGPEWARIMQERAVQANDFVRLEIENALTLDKLVIPVLVMNATMPDFSQLPASLEPLQWRNVAIVRRQPDLASDCTKLAEGLRKALNITKPTVPVSLPSEVAEPENIQRWKALSIQHNADWQPYITTFQNLKLPDMEFCLVPPGTFQMGSNDIADEKPIHSRTFSQHYWLARYPVTNAQWQSAVNARVVKAPEGEQALRWYADIAMANYPVVGVSWGAARQFCEWAGCCLPTESEWEYAARGVDSFIYPWGNDWENGNRVAWRKESESMPSSVTSKVRGRSWIGAQHLSGNVWEWTSSLYEPYQPQATDTSERNTTNNAYVRYVLRGGSWFYSDPDDFRASCRLYSTPVNFHDDWGFRCAFVQT